MPLQSDAKPTTQAIKRNKLNLKPNDKTESKEKISVINPKQLVEQFVERKHLLISSFEYPRDGDDPGLVLIFNQQTFLNYGDRYGSNRDVNEIITCMSRLGFNINENRIFNDLSKTEILQVVNDIVKTDLSQVNCLIVFFLSHGDSVNTLHAHDDDPDDPKKMPMKSNEFWKGFADCRDLKNKPKIFIFQACKGDKHSTISDKKKQKINLVDDSTFKSNHIGPDMLIVYSATEGNESFRDTKRGTWFIQELCKNFSAYGRRDDVISLIIRTTKCVCRNYFHVADNDQDEDENELKIKKQMPIFISTLRRKFYLNRSKERNILFHFLKVQEAMGNKIKELEDKVYELLQDKEKRNK